MVYIGLGFTLLLTGVHWGLAASLQWPLELGERNRLQCAKDATKKTCLQLSTFRQCLYECSKIYELYANATLSATTDENIVGNFFFRKDGTEASLVIGIVDGLSAGRSYGLQIVNSPNDCAAAHFNPLIKDVHGNLDSNVRHAGDLGNIVGQKNDTAILLHVKDVVGIPVDIRYPVDKTSLVIFEEANNYYNPIFEDLSHPLSCGPIVLDSDSD